MNDTYELAIDKTTELSINLVVGLIAPKTMKVNQEDISAGHYCHDQLLCYS